MNYTRENGTHYFGQCEKCGKELKAVKANCSKDPIGYKTNHLVMCSCGESSWFVKTPKKPNPILVERENHEDDDQVKCPKCKSNQLHAENRGFGLTKAAVGGFILGSPVGLLGGLVGSKKVMITCIKCGHRWQAGKQN